MKNLLLSMSLSGSVIVILYIFFYPLAKRYLPNWWRYAVLFLAMFFYLFPDLDKMKQNRFHPKGEYVDIYADEYRFAAPENVLIIPEGAYVCYVTDVKENYADFRVLEQWLDQNGYTADFVIADEIGFQLFAYNQYFYPCEIKVLLSVT